MTTEDITHSHQLVVRFDQDESGQVTWHIEPDDAVRNTALASYEELAGQGAPLAALGVRVLWGLCSQELIEHALEKANIFLWKEYFRRLSEQNALESQQPEEATVIH